MDSSLDSFLFDRMDVYVRLSRAFDEVNQRFWAKLGGAVHTIVEEILGEDFENTFGQEYWDTNWQGFAFDRDWLLALKGDRQEWERSPGLWFPITGQNDFDLLNLLALADPPFLDLTVWATPLSEFTGNLATARVVWEENVGAPLKLRGWESYGDRVTKPAGDWGLRHPVVLDHREIADGLRAGDLRPALAPVEKLVDDFASVCPAMTKLVDQIRVAQKGV